MTTQPDDNILGFYANLMVPDSDQEVIKNYLWGADGLRNKLIHLSGRRMEMVFI
jgi:hypothetical protein